MSTAALAAIGKRKYPIPNNLPMRGRFVANPFSNLKVLPFSILLGDLKFNSNELRYVASKTKDASTRKLIMSMEPSQAKRFGSPRNNSSFPMREDWDDVFMSSMWSGLVQIWTRPEKLAELRAMLTPIVEWNNWGDLRWGCEIRPGKGFGHNILGRMLTMIAEGREIDHPLDEASWPALQLRLIEEIAKTHLEYAIDRKPEEAPPAPQSTQSGFQFSF